MAVYRDIDYNTRINGTLTVSQSSTFGGVIHAASINDAAEDSLTITGSTIITGNLTVQGSIIGIDLSQYYTKTNLQTSGQAQVHVENITGISDYAKLNASNIFTATSSNIKIKPSSDVSTARTNEVVTFSSETMGLTYKPIDSLSETVKSDASGTITYARDVDYSIHYPTGRITRIADGSIPSGGTVYVDYTSTAVVFSIVNPTDTETHYSIDNRGNVSAKSMTVTLTSSFESSGGGSEGDFTVNGNLIVNGNVTFGDNSGTDNIAIKAALDLYDTSDASVFSIDRSGNLDFAGTLSIDGVRKDANWDTAYTHSQATHAPSDAPSNATFIGHTGDTVVHITSEERITWDAKSNLGLGETSTTAHRGDHGKAAYDHISSNGSSHSYINQDVTTTSTPTFTGVNVSSIESIRATGSLDNKVITVDSAQIAQSPITGFLWHDIFAFCRESTPLYETSVDGSIWEEELLDKNLFAQKENQARTVIPAGVLKAVRWTWSSGTIHSNLRWLILAYTYSSPYPNITVTAESSADGVTWTNRHTSTYTVTSAPRWHYISDTELYFRLTITHNSGADVKLSSIRGLTYRWGDQGLGSELSYPYSWDANMNMTVLGGTLKVGPYTVWHSGNLVPSSYLSSTGGTINGDLTVSGNLTVTGTLATGVITTTNTNMVTNLNAHKLGGFEAKDILGATINTTGYGVLTGCAVSGLGTQEGISVSAGKLHIKDYGLYTYNGQAAITSGFTQSYYHIVFIAGKTESQYTLGNIGIIAAASQATAEQTFNGLTNPIKLAVIPPYNKSTVANSDIISARKFIPVISDGSIVSVLRSDRENVAVNSGQHQTVDRVLISRTGDNTKLTVQDPRVLVDIGGTPTWVSRSLELKSNTITFKEEATSVEITAQKVNTWDSAGSRQHLHFYDALYVGPTTGAGDREYITISTYVPLASKTRVYKNGLRLKMNSSDSAWDNDYWQSGNTITFSEDIIYASSNPDNNDVIVVDFDM